MVGVTTSGVGVSLCHPASPQPKSFKANGERKRERERERKREKKREREEEREEEARIRI